MKQKISRKTQLINTDKEVETQSPIFLNICISTSLHELNNNKKSSHKEKGGRSELVNW